EGDEKRQSAGELRDSAHMHVVAMKSDAGPLNVPKPAPVHRRGRRLAPPFATYGLETPETG
ncbi:MAG: hypothetical protein M9951_14510, partial [Burkholderiaceae bacterium]|nr:hypothetical protein [Burkholderiaceae bacterium]